MVKRAKGFGESLQHKQESKNHQKFMKRFQQQVKEGNLKDAVLVENPSGEVKMSEVLEEFVKPYLDFANNRTETTTLFTIAAAAWNIALLPKDKHQSEINTVLDTVFQPEDRQMEQDLREMLTAMVARKLIRFPKNRRMIADFQLQQTGRGDFHLSVASTLPQP